MVWLPFALARSIAAADGDSIGGGTVKRRNLVLEVRVFDMDIVSIGL